MKVVARQAEMTELARRWRRAGESIGFAPTMGALHRGHASLIERARRENRRVVVSVFVNPTQFGPREDYARYPRAFSKDLRLCAAGGADVVYHPTAEQIYPEGFLTSVEVEGLSDVLCGESRPGHFRGVATIVLKLLETVRPARAYFGEKDYHQLAIIRRMVQDLGCDAEIVGCPTVRESDGLALSSRNAYLAPLERSAAPLLYAALKLGKRLTQDGALAPQAISARVRWQILKSIPGAGIDYVSLVDASTLKPARALRGPLRLLAAIRLGKTRLIDNIALSL